MENNELDEVNPTILAVEVFPQVPEKREHDDFVRIRELLSDHGFSIADISTERGSSRSPILTDAFIRTSDHLESAEDIQKTLSEWFPEHEVTYSPTYLDSYRETAIFPETQFIAVLHSE